MNLKPEQIPDETASLALEVYDRSFKSGHDSSINHMKAAIAAALPALLGEPVMWRASCAGGKFMHFDYEPKHMRQYRPLYTLSTQDTPNADQ